MSSLGYAINATGYSKKSSKILLVNISRVTIVSKTVSNFNLGFKA